MNCTYIYIYLVGGFNPSEKILYSQIGSSSQLLGNIKNDPNISKPPTRNIPAKTW